MDNLRLILFISGILVIAAIYAWEVFRERRTNMRQRLDIFGDDTLAQQDTPSNEFYADTDTQPYLGQSEQTVVEAKDNVVLGDLNALDGYDTQNEPAATISDDPQTGPTEEDAVEGIGVADEKTAKRITDPDPPIDTNTDAPILPAGKSRTEKMRSERAHARSNQEKSRSGRTTTGRSSSAKGLVLGLTIMAKSGRRFMGPSIREQLENAGMHFGEMRIFHHFGPDGQKTDQSVFSAADIMEPGTFPINDLGNYTTKGLILFMQLPGPLDGLVAFELMLNVAQKLAKSLEGELCDDTRSTLTTQAANHLRERIEEMKRKQLV
ncbi:MAG: cell division protein ZipA [Gammaproteobacteria bacterium]|nr:cell division protein ZipA [Gammaproteobacteria bacterium]NNJ85105.1 cell division protein ZipA [Gammaproteobacteria bacterium]